MENFNLLKNQEYDADIIGYNSDGQGIARINGRAVFIPNTIQGEKWRIHIVKVTANAVYAKGISPVLLSPERIESECAYSAKCGGCALWHMSYNEELAYKKSRINDALERLGGQNLKVEAVVGGDDYRYRNKGIFNIAEVDGEARYGFFQQHSHHLVAIEKCLIQMPLGERVSAFVCDFLNRHHIKPYCEETGKGSVRHVFCRSAVYTDDAVACIISATGFGALTKPFTDELRTTCPELTGIVLCINKERYNTILAGSFYTLYGNDYIRDYLGRNEFEISIQSFYQVNPRQAEKLYSIAVSYACKGICKTAVELYCGAGTISMFLSGHFEKVYSTEVVPEAIENAKNNANRNHISNIEFLCGDAGETATYFHRQGIQPDCVLVDPPRKGMDRNAVEAVVRMEPQRIVYVSCDPATLARDIRIFNELGYTLSEVSAVDMFPRTAHVETVAYLMKSDAKEE